MTNETVMEEKKKTKKDVNFIGNELASVSDRMLEVETELKRLQKKLDQVAGRMGL